MNYCQLRGRLRLITVGRSMSRSRRYRNISTLSTSLSEIRMVVSSITEIVLWMWQQGKTRKPSFHYAKGFFNFPDDI